MVLWYWFCFVLFCVSAESEVDNSWDFILFVQQWSGTVCPSTNASSPNCAARFPFWTLHGLWPNRNNGSWPQFCPGPKFNQHTITGFLPEMKTWWPSYAGKNDTAFWQHEWDKHGTCAINGQSGQLQTDLQYFRMALNIVNQFNAAKLAAANIVPSKNVTYNLDDILNAITRFFGVTGVVNCNNKQQIQEIQLCLGYSLQLVNCPTTVTTRCKRTGLSYPPN